MSPHVASGLDHQSRFLNVERAMPVCFRLRLESRGVLLEVAPKNLLHRWRKRTVPGHGEYRARRRDVLVHNSAAGRLHLADFVTVMLHGLGAGVHPDAIGFNRADVGAKRRPRGQRHPEQQQANGCHAEPLESRLPPSCRRFRATQRCRFPARGRSTGELDGSPGRGERRHICRRWGAGSFMCC